MAANTIHFTRPWHTSELTAEAAKFPYNPDVPLKYWLRTGDLIQKQAQSYERDGDDQHAYFLYMRYVLLFLEKLPTHPEAKLPEHRKALAHTNKTLNKDLERLEALKPGLDKRAERYDEAVARGREAGARAVEEAGRSSTDSAHDLDHPSHTHRRGLFHHRHALEAKEHTSLAAKLARRDKRKRQTRTDGSEPRRSGDGRPRSWATDDADLTAQLIEAGRRGQLAVAERNGTVTGATPTHVSEAAPNYPTVPGRSAMAAWDDMKMRQPHPSGPDVPPKHLQHGATFPPVPPKLRDESATPSPPPRSSTSTPDINPREFTFKPSAFLESGTPLRTVFTPPSLRSTFLAHAAPNTALGREFLGILCGTLISNAFFVTRLVLPAQSATSDTCEMSAEGEVGLWEHCDAHDLLTLGWIHTHPTQTCFMSSRDLHTHSGYQAQLAESVAVVCAPSREPSSGVFRLTDPPGLKHVLACTKAGVFHPHEVGNLYTDAMKPGHVCELPGLEFEVVDLRK